MAEKWFHCHQKRESASLLVFCFPWAGGGCSSYMKMSGLFPPNCEVWAAKLPGREARFCEDMVNDLNTLCDFLSEALCGQEKPFVFVGHSMGGKLMFETSRRLREKGKGPLAIFVSASSAPHCPRFMEPIGDLPDRKFIEKIRKMGGLPDAIIENEEMLEIVIPILRNDFQSVERYIFLPCEPFDFPIYAYGGKEDDLPIADLEGWKRHTKGEFSLRMFEGGHFYLLGKEAELVADIQEKLEALTREE